MVSSYLICDLCGNFGPPASFLSQDGLRLCYQCWYRERQGDAPEASEPRPADANEVAEPGAGSERQPAAD